MNTNFKQKTNWQTKKLGVVCSVFGDGDWIEKKDQSPEGIRLIQTGNIGNGIFKDRGEKARYISEKTFKRLHCTEVFPADCLISRLPDPVGRACIIPNTGERMITAVDCTIVRFPKDILPQWFVYYSLSQEYQTQIDKEVSGATRQRISRNNLGLIEIPVPPLAEQKQIVKILDEVFGGIEKAKENAEKNLKNSQELFESYLQNIFAIPGKDWDTKKIGEVCGLKSGTTISKSLEKSSGNVLYVKVGDMNFPGNEIFINSSSRFVNAGDVSIKQVIPEGSVIFPKRGGAIFTNKRRKIIKPTIVDLNTMALVPSKLLDPELLYYWFLGIDLTDLNNGSSIPQINNYSFDNIFISYPKSISEQGAVVKKLDALSGETKKLEAIFRRKIADLDELKKSILKQAFSGEL